MAACARLGLLLQIMGALLLAPAFGQVSWEHGGFLEESGQLFARRPNPSDTYAAGAGYFHLWSRAAVNNRLSFRGALDFRIDTHRDVSRRDWFELGDRGVRQPAGALSELYADLKLGHLDLRLGKQQIRWGRADGFNPTDNLNPYDYLDTFADRRIAVPAVKADAFFGRAHFEGAWLPFYTPTRLPLIGQRWFPRLPTGTPVQQIQYHDLGGPVPAGTLGNGQWAVRYNQIIPGAEFSVSYFDGFDDLPFFRASGTPLLAEQAIRVDLRREYFRVHVVGADFASGIGPVGIRGEAAYFDQTDPLNLDHLLFVIGLDKSWGDWFAIVQYAGQKVSGRVEPAAVFPDLGLRSTLLYRVERTLGPDRTFEIKGALRLRDGDFLIQPLYSVALSNKWRLKIGTTLFAGASDGYLGQFRYNSHLNLSVTYTF
jgi:hypothetical protein